MSNANVGGYISKIVFNNGQTVDITQNDIILFVGPNNAGKSQSLDDIYRLCERKPNGIVIRDVEILKHEGSVLSLLEKVAKRNRDRTYLSYSFLDLDIAVDKGSDMAFQREDVYGRYRNLFVANLNASQRLLACFPPNNIPRDSKRDHPIQYAAFEPTYRKWLSKCFKKAFGSELIPNTQFGGSIPLCIGEPVKLNQEFGDEQERQEAYANILAQYKQVHNQGDGIKSFTGIILYLMMKHYCTYLIDEPEAFLHPPQARILGQIIGETLSGQQQAFISTHSDEIIKGLFETCPDRLKIIRITREDDINYFSILSNADIVKVWGDPLLRHSNILSSLFHKNVVLCESDSDCQMYSIIDNHLKQKQGKYSETLFIHCGGKQRMAKVVTALRSLNVDVKLIPDMDVLNDEGVFRAIVESFGIAWDEIKDDYKIFVSHLHSPRDTIKREDAKSSIISILDESTDTILSKDELKKLQETLKTTSKWENIKKMGISAIPAGDSRAAFDRLNTILKDNGIHLVPVGELECFVKTIGNHGPRWVNEVLESYPDFDDLAYLEIRSFILGIDL